MAQKKKSKKNNSKWWLWIIAVIIVGGMAGSLGFGIAKLTSSGNAAKVISKFKNNANEEIKREKSKAEEKVQPESEEKNKAEIKEELKKEEPKKDDSRIEAGSYKVGSDIPAGEYVVFSEDYMGYIECCKDSSGDFESIIMNENVLRHTIVSVSDGQYVNLQTAFMYPIDKSPDLKPNNGVYESGMYKVGVHIPAGEYKVSSSEEIGGYFEVSSDSTHQLEKIITNDNIEAEKYITLQDGQYLKLVGTTININ